MIERQKERDAEDGETGEIDQKVGRRSCARHAEDDDDSLPVPGSGPKGGEDAAKLGSLEVPLHLRNAPTRLMKEIGYGKGYRYAHDEPGGYAAGERYFPDDMPDRRYYVPVTRGLEIKIGEALAARRARDSKVQDAGKS